MTAALAVLPAVAVPARLPMPHGAVIRGITPEQWRVLCDVIFPSARSAESILLAYDYCRARALDVFKRMIHIVPVWNSTLKREVETIWPGIAEIQTTATRTREYAGMDSPKFGPMMRRTFKGSRKIGDGWKPVSVEVHFPEWCEITVYRLVNGHRCPFTERVYWIESYSTTGGRDSELPTDMWARRPRMQVAKVAKAAALRAGFPEDADYCAEEMEGKSVDAGGVLIEHEPVSDATVTEAEPAKVPAYFDLLIPGDDVPQIYPKTKRGIQSALKEIGATCNDPGGTGILELNREILDWMARAGFAEEVAQLRADPVAEDALDPDPEAEPDGFVQTFVDPDAEG